MYDSAIEEHERSKVAEREDEDKERKRGMQSEGKDEEGVERRGRYKGELASPHHPANHDPVTIAADP